MGNGRQPQASQRFPTPRMFCVAAQGFEDARGGFLLVGLHNRRGGFRRFGPDQRVATVGAFPTVGFYRSKEPTVRKTLTVATRYRRQESAPVRQCIFCNNKANSREHAWPQWVLQKLPNVERLRHHIGESPEILLDKPELKIKCVCSDCNQGWMSRLEDASKPIIGALTDDISLWLDTVQQSQVAIWCMKTAMVVEQVNARKRTPCYDQMEREELRLTSAIPIQTLMWLGRCSLRS
ncbi:MAG: hypothetical protein ACRD2O_13445, partial [Terriglobia bacterium]